MKTFLIGCLGMLVMVAPAWAINIAWVSGHDTDTASAAAQTFAFEDAPDQGYVDLLRDNGHTVTRVLEQSPTADYAANLSTFDLIIAGRQVNSPNFQDEPERVLWHGISKPMIYMSGYVLRNNRLQFFTGDTIPDAGNQAPVTLIAAAPSHPIFQGITLDGANSMQFATYPISTPADNLQRGISVVTNPVAGGGTVLARVGTPGDPALNGALIAHWPAGAQLGANTLAGQRMIFMSGTREHDGGGVPTAGVHDLTAAGDQLFLNAVCFLGTCGPPIVPGDTDGNGIVQFVDFEPIRANFQKSVSARNQGDLVPDGIVNFDDFRQWKASFVGGGGSLAGLDLSFASRVPEPSAAVLVLIGLCGLAIGSRGVRAVGE